MLMLLMGGSASNPCGSNSMQKAGIQAELFRLLTFHDDEDLVGSLLCSVSCSWLVHVAIYVMYGQTLKLVVTYFRENALVMSFFSSSFNYFISYFLVLFNYFISYLVTLNSSVHLFIFSVSHS